MTKRPFSVLLVALVALFLAPLSAAAQARFWVQIEAHATLRTAEEFAARYQQRIGNITGFRIAGGWYALAVGPFSSEAAAEAQRANLFSTREIRNDAYVTDGTIYGAQFWPADVEAATLAPIDGAVDDGFATPESATGPDAATQSVADPAQGTAEQTATENATAQAATDEPAVAQTTQVATAEETLAEPPAEPVVEEIPEETVADARRNERNLSRDERAQIQTALQWFGHYTQRIDAQFGPGTRGSIIGWQEANGYEGSGFLTTRQRRQLMESYDAALARYAFTPFRDEAAGIEITLPLGMIAFDRHEAPFAHFREVGESGMRALLLSQEGSQTTLFGLYEILQTLEVIPLDGERDRGRSSFIITGQNATSRAHVEARLRNGEIKGWALLWEPGADEDAQRVIETMRESFSEIAGVLPSSLGAAPSRVARQELLAGLEVRRPEHSRTGFFIDSVGTVVTTREAVEGCGRITLDEAYTATVRGVDEASGIAVLTPDDPLVPLAFAQIAAQDPGVGSEIRVAGFSYEDTLTRPILTFGALSDMKGLEGETYLRRLTLEAQPGDSGGPVFDGRGAVVGMLMPRMETPGRMLPEDVNFAVSLDALRTAISDAGVQATESRATAAMSPQILTRVAADLTVLVSCWQ